MAMARTRTRGGWSVVALWVMGAAGAVAAVASAGCNEARQAPSQPNTGGAFSPQPQNLAIALTAARLTADSKVQVDYTLADGSGAPLATATDVAASWTLAAVKPDPATGAPGWQSLLTTHVKGAKGETDQPSSESNGLVENLGGGSYRYTYAKPLPAGSDPAATYRAAVYARRPVPNTIPQVNDIANGVVDFVPAGGTPQPHDAVSTQACNGCHGILQAHGGARRETRLCATCHTTQLVDPDTNDTNDPSKLNPLDFPTLVHRIHRGSDLPTVVDAAATGDAAWAYHVIGFGGADNVWGATKPNPDPSGTGLVTTGVGFPQDIRSCAVCHAPAKDAQGNVQYAPQAADAWKTPSVRVCQSCHDGTAFTGASESSPHHQPHPGGLVDADPSLATRCAACHDVASIHTTLTASPSFNALQFTISGVTADDGQAVSPTKPVKVSFKAQNADGSPITDLSGFQGQTGRLAITISGPTTDYAAGNVVTQTVPTATSATGDYAATVSFPPGATPTGTWAAGIEARRKNATLSAAAGASVYDFARNPVSYFAADGGAVKPRRQVVSTDACNACHGVLTAHGSLRHDVEYCLMCHAPDNTDAAQRTAATQASKPIIDKLPARSIHFVSLIHSIHTGEDLSLQAPFIVYGFGGSPTFLGETRFPGTRAACSHCHVGGSFTMEAIPGDAAPTQSVQVSPSTVNASGAVTTAGAVGTLPPNAAACLSCHDTVNAHHHVNEMIQASTAPGQAPVETCQQCHGEGGVVSVRQVHAELAR
jgi:OmcA/MtrC family decaheme c-type cytochrome